jgi:hypothetical protein
MNTHLTNVWVGMIVVTTALSVCQGQPADMIRNGSFEQDTDGDGMADSWQFSGDKSVVVQWARDEGFAGRFSQKLQCTQFTGVSSASHAMLCQVNTLRLEKGKWYKISFAARQQSIPGGAVHVAISDTQAWQNCGLDESLRVRTAWHPFEFIFRATETISDHMRLQFWYTSTGTFWLDDVRLEPAVPVQEKFTEVLPPAAGVNLLRNSSFECGTGCEDSSRTLSSQNVPVEVYQNWSRTWSEIVSVAWNTNSNSRQAAWAWKASLSPQFCQTCVSEIASWTPPPGMPCSLAANAILYHWPFSSRRVFTWQSIAWLAEEVLVNWVHWSF